MSHFILMLTENDATVTDAIATYDSLRDSPSITSASRTSACLSLR